MLTRAFSLIEVKALDDERREISGWATTPSPDRVLDVIDPFGVRVATPDIPLFLYHDSTKTVGRARLDTPIPKGVWFVAKIAKISDPGTLRDRVDEAWGLVKHRLVTGISVGFIPVPGKAERLPTGGTLYNEVEVVELSLCPIPMNAEATIHTIKSAWAAAPVHRPEVVDADQARADFDAATRRGDFAAMERIAKTRGFAEALSREAADEAKGWANDTDTIVRLIAGNRSIARVREQVAVARLAAMQVRLDKLEQRLSATNKAVAAVARSKDAA